MSEVNFVGEGFLPIQERTTVAGQPSSVKSYIWGQNMGGGIGGLLNMRQQGQNYHYLYDGKGNVSAVLDSAQQIVASYRYDTFGRLMAKSGTLDQPFQFSTKYYDQNTGLNYYGYRFYSPALGRWINRDPLGEEGGVNLYGFVGNDPVNALDYLGLDPMKPVPGKNPWTYRHETWPDEHYQFKYRGEPVARKVFPDGRQIPHGPGVNRDVPKSVIKNTLGGVLNILGYIPTFLNSLTAHKRMEQSGFPLTAIIQIDMMGSFCYIDECNIVHCCYENENGDIVCSSTFEL